eukprot:SAG11_NODE_17118_length_528_cov_0.846154_2_plen_109_part_01
MSCAPDPSCTTSCGAKTYTIGCRVDCHRWLTIDGFTADHNTVVQLQDVVNQSVLASQPTNNVSLGTSDSRAEQRITEDTHADKTAVVAERRRSLDPTELAAISETVSSV